MGIETEDFKGKTTLEKGVFNISFLLVHEPKVNMSRKNSMWEKGASAVSKCCWDSQAVADPGGAKDRLPLTVAPGMQGPLLSVCEMPLFL